MKTCSRCSAVFFEPAYGRVCQRCLDREKEAKRQEPKPAAPKPTTVKPTTVKPTTVKPTTAKPTAAKPGPAPTFDLAVQAPALTPALPSSRLAPSMWEDPGLFIHAPWRQPDPREQAKELLAEAEKLLEEATKLDPDNAKARENLAQVRTIRSQVG